MTSVKTITGFISIILGLTFLSVLSCGRRHNPVGVQKIISKCPTPGYATDLFVLGNYAYIVDGQAGLTIIDISDVNTPRITGTCHLEEGKEGYAQGIKVKGSFAYLACGDEELVVIDVSDPKMPTVKQYIGSAVLDYGYDICIFQKDTVLFAFIACKRESRTFDVTNLELVPSEIFSARYSTPGNALGVYFCSNFIYIADEQMGLHIIDEADPYNPIQAGWCDTPGRANAVFVVGNYAYVADGYKGLQIIDVSNPKEAKIVGNYDTPGYAAKVFVDGNRAYVADKGKGVQVIDVTNPTSPSLVGGCLTPYATSVCVSQNHVYISDKDEGLIIVQK